MRLSERRPARGTARGRNTVRAGPHGLNRYSSIEWEEALRNPEPLDDITTTRTFPRLGGFRPSAPVRSDEEVAERFLVLKDDWIAATSLSSSTTEIVFHPSYQQIIGLGPQ